MEDLDLKTAKAFGTVDGKVWKRFRVMGEDEDNILVHPRGDNQFDENQKVRIKKSHVTWVSHAMSDFEIAKKEHAREVADAMAEKFFETQGDDQQTLEDL